jgi:hypothetical protein
LSSVQEKHNRLLGSNEWVSEMVLCC